MNFKDFLIDNYIWIIIVIILIIITIIGFLADKKKNQNKRANTMGGTIENPGPNPSNMTYQQPNMNQPINYQQGNVDLGNTVQPVSMPNNLINNQIQPNNNLAPQMNNINAPINNNIQPAEFGQPEMPNQNPMGQMNYNAPGPVEPLNVTPNPQPETMYQPLSEQTPSFNPVDASANMMNNQVPTSMPGQGINPIQNGPIPQPVNMQPIPTGNIMEPNQIDPMVMATNPMNNPMPGPMPAEPIPNQGGNVMPGPVAPPQPVSPQPINFMYGNQNNNGSIQ